MNDDQKDTITGICFVLVCCLAAICGGLMAFQLSQYGLPVPILP